MSARVDRALRFLHPDFDSGARTLGLSTSPTGGLELAAGDPAVRQAVLLLLTTNPGERVMRPDYGCDLRSLVFSPDDDTTAGLAVHLVRRAVERWEPRAQIVRVEVERHRDAPGHLTLILEYRVRGTSSLGSLHVPVTLNAGAP